jgi:hypothetical protein
MKYATRILAFVRSLRAKNLNPSRMWLSTQMNDNLDRPRRYIRVGSSSSDDPYFSPWFLVLASISQGLMAEILLGQRFCH